MCEHPASPDDSRGNCPDNNVFLAGFDSTATALAWCVIRLAESVDLYRELQREVHQALTDPRHITSRHFRDMPGLVQFLATVLDECPPFRVFFRNVTEHHTLDDEHLSPGDQIIVMSKEAKVPFGAGGRKCVGESLARMNSLTTLATILHRTESLTRPADNSGDRIDYAIITPPADGASIQVTLTPETGGARRARRHCASVRSARKHATR